MSLTQTLINASTTRDVGRWDRGVRALLPFVLGGLWLTGVLPAVAAIPLLVFTVMLFPTSLTGACSTCHATGISTLPEQDGSRPGRTAA